MSEDTYWLALATDLGMPRTPECAEIAKRVYNTWEPAVWPTFTDYVKWLREQPLVIEVDNARLG